jgi:hypothetical protein
LDVIEVLSILCIVCNKYQGRGIELRYYIGISGNVPLKDARTKKKKDTNHLVT